VRLQVAVAAALQGGSWACARVGQGVGGAGWALGRLRRWAARRGKWRCGWAMRLGGELGHSATVLSEAG